MSELKAWAPSRRMLLAAAVGLFAAAADADELPLLRSARQQFVQFEPQPTMRPLMLQDLQGRPALLGLPSHEAKLLYIWATWCPSCAVELPRLARDQAKLRRLGISISTVNIDTRPAAAVDAFLRKFGVINLQVLKDPDGSTLSAENSDGTTSAFKRWSMPLTFAIDRTGRIRGYIAGSIEWLKPESAAFLEALTA